MKAMYPFVGGSAASCAQNLKSSSFNATFSSGWTFTSNGASTSGSGTMNTTFICSDNFADEKISMSTYVANYTTNITIGALDGNNHIYDWRSNPLISVHNGTGVTMSPMGSGMGILSRINTTQIQYKNNNQSVQTRNQDFIAINTQPIHIGSFSGIAFFSGGSYRFGHIGEVLTSQNQDDFFDTVQAFQTTLNRQV
jgi:hypothetical protein